MTHTPTPWTYDGANIVGHDRTVVATVNRPPGDYSSDAYGNRSLIIRAVNCHADLLEACQSARALIAKIYGKVGDEGHPFVVKFDAAIAKATGQA